MCGININNITLGYFGNIIFNGFNLIIHDKKITAIIGANGCGKSTLLKAIARIQKPEQGTIYVSNNDVFLTSTKLIAKKLALLPQNPYAPASLTVEDLVGYGRFPHKKGFGVLNSEDKKIIESALIETNLINLRDREIGTLSGGQRQRVWIALALCQDSDIILLDEPTTYLDLSYQIEVLDLLVKLNKKNEKTIVMVLHDINLASKYSDYIIGLKNGKVIACGEPCSVVTKENVLKMYGVNAKIIENDYTKKPVCIDFEVGKN